MNRQVTIYSRIKAYEKPRYTHDCSHCKYVGQLENFDVYVCGDSVIYRAGDEPSEYGSIPVAFFKTITKT